MANVRLFGETSGFVQLAAPDAAGNNTITLPTTGTELVAADATGNITIDGTATFAVGASGTPAITASGDANTGIYFPAADTIAFTEGGNEVVRIDSSGRVGIGTTSPGSLDAFGDDLVIGGGSGHRGATIYSGTGSQGVIYFADGTTGGDVARGKVFYSHSDNYLAFDTDATERMRIDSSGNLRFNSGYGSVATAYGCRAWANGNCSTDTLRGSGNVSSITEIGGGEHRFNYTTAITDANYSIVATAGGISGATGDDSNASLTSSEVITTSCRVRTNATNPLMINIAVFR